MASSRGFPGRGRPSCWGSTAWWSASCYWSPGSPCLWWARLGGREADCHCQRGKIRTSITKPGQISHRDSEHHVWSWRQLSPSILISLFFFYLISFSCMMRDHHQHLRCADLVHYPQSKLLSQRSETAGWLQPVRLLDRSSFFPRQTCFGRAAGSTVSQHLTTSAQFYYDWEESLPKFSK